MQQEKDYFKLSFPNTNISKEEIIEDLKSISIQKGKITESVYGLYGKYSVKTVINKFGTWNNAMKLANLNKNLEFNKSNEEMFENIKDMWLELGRQPIYSECKKPLSKFHAITYARRFGSWKKALESFIEYINQNEIEDKIEITDEDRSNTILITHQIIKRKTKRDISERMRFRILVRDGFRCQSCGKSPITTPGIELHVDHIIPWSKGGETIPENLECKCKECNLGKGNAFDV